MTRPEAFQMRELTPRQREILDLIKRHLATTGFPPTRAEIAADLGFRSANAAEEHLKALARKGVIELTSGASRGIRLVLPPSLDASTAPQGASRSTPDRRPRAANTLLDSTLQAVQAAMNLPLIGRVSAGHPILAQEHVEASYAIDPGLFGARPDYLLKVRGLSMRDAGILDGDLLAVKQAADARNGQIVVARIGNEVTVKRFRRHPTRGTIELLPENPDFQTIVVDARSEEFALEGIGVGLIRKTASAL
jgi:repressor LexA